MPSGFRERLRQKPDTRECREATQMPLVVLEGEPFKEILAHPSLGASQPAEVRQVVAHLLDEFHLLTQEVFLQEVSEMRVCVDRTQGIQVQKGRFRFFSMTMVASMVSKFYPTHVGTASAHPGRGGLPH